MELKPNNGQIAFELHALLIVPYGIETASRSFVTKEGRKLLIVPYGIETLLFC